MDRTSALVVDGRRGLRAQSDSCREAGGPAASHEVHKLLTMRTCCIARSSLLSFRIEIDFHSIDSPGYLDIRVCTSLPARFGYGLNRCGREHKMVPVPKE